MQEKRKYSAVARRVARGVLTVALAATTFVGTIPVGQAQAATPSRLTLFTEQVASQKLIQALIGIHPEGSSEIQSIKFGKVSRAGSRADVAIIAHSAGGSNIAGVMRLLEVSGKWYFWSITRGTHVGTVSNVALPSGISSTIMAAAVTQQTKHQTLISGIITGRYKTLTVTSRHGNFGTRTVNVKMSGGSAHSATGQIVSIMKKDASGRDFWFLTDFR